LKVTYDLDPVASNVLVPHMILQPLVENAIVHGAAGSRNGGWLAVRSRIESGLLELELKNSVAPQPIKKGRSGIGLSNTRARIQNLFDKDAFFQFSIAGDCALTQIRIPILNKRELANPKPVSTDKAVAV
jgi:sensor histidine kinase YesM